MRRILIATVVVMVAFPVVAAPPAPPPSPSAEDILSQSKIQIGQLLIQLGNAELEISKLHKQLEAAKSKDEPKASHP